MDTKDTLPICETRALIGLEVRAAAEGDPHIGTLLGYAAVFNSDSRQFGGKQFPWVERITPGAFTRSLKENPGVVALWGHDVNSPVARAPKSLRLAEDTKGLSVEIDLPDTSVARDLLTNVKAGVVDAMSFAFRVVKETWEEQKDRDVRTLEDVDLFEVSAVVFPAYLDTSLAVRSHDQFREGLMPPKPITPMRDYWSRRLGLRSAPL